jgi:D-sedoheptulose 7-phosphate isomerase
MQRYIEDYLLEVIQIVEDLGLQHSKISKMIEALEKLRKEEGRLFILGVGGSAANASHAVGDFRKLCRIEAYAPTDNVSELTAWTNDAGWRYSFDSYLMGSKLTEKDVILVLSVSGGDKENNTSPNLILAILHAQLKKAKVLGIVGRDNGFTAKTADVCIVIPKIVEERVTAHAEEFQGIILHLIANCLSLERIPNANFH